MTYHFRSDSPLHSTALSATWKLVLYFANNWPTWRDCYQRLWLDILDIVRFTNCYKNEWMNEWIAASHVSLSRLLSVPRWIYFFRRASRADVGQRIAGASNYRRRRRSSALSFTVSLILNNIAVIETPYISCLFLYLTGTFLYIPIKFNLSKLSKIWYHHRHPEQL